MSDCRIDQLSVDLLKRLNHGYFNIELNQNGEHKLFLDEGAMNLFDVDSSLNPAECFKFLADHIEADDRKMVGNSIEMILIHDNAEFCFVYNKKDGSKINVRCSGVKNKGKKAGVRIEGYALDITKTIILQKMTQKYQDELYDKFYVMPFIGFLKNASNSTFLAVSKPFLDLIGKTREEVVGHSDAEIFEGEMLQRVVQEDKYTLCIDRPLNLSEMHVDPEGNSHYFQTYRNKFIDSLGRVVIFAMSIDVTEMHVLNEEKQKLAARAKKKAEESNQAKTRFLYNVSQDIRNPVNDIVASLDRAFRHEQDKDTVKDSLNKIKESANVLLNTVNDISEVVSLNYGRVELNETPGSLSDFIKDIADEYKEYADQKSVAIRYDFNGFRNKYACFDKEKIQKIFRNLVSNAVKFSNLGGKVLVKGKQLSADIPGHSKFIIDVEDNGKGMSEEFLANIFGLFEKERSTMESGEQGSGLGMAIVKALVTAMKGEIKIDSAINKGTTVQITLILRNSSKEKAEEVSNNTVDLAYAKNLAKGKKVLLVDDNETFVENTKDILEEFGLEVETACNGAVATNIVSRKGIDDYGFILMSAQMPVMDGFEASREFKSLFTQSETPIIIMSASDILNVTKEDENSVDMITVKPLNAEKIKEIIVKYLN